MKILVTKGGIQLGPYSPEEVLARIKAAELLPDDLGWHEGLSAWTPLSSLLSSSALATPPPPPLGEATVGTVYAGFWRRLAAVLIDWFVLVIPTFAIGFILGVVASQEGIDSTEELELLGNVIGLLLGWLYFASMESSTYQATLGKLALGIKVTDERGHRIGFGRATGRHFGKIVSALILCIGFIMAGTTQRKQALHDTISGCLVVLK